MNKTTSVSCRFFNRQPFLSGSQPACLPQLDPHPFAVVVSAVELFGFGLALNHGVHSLEVRGVGHQRQSNVPVCDAVYTTMVHAQVVLHVSRTLNGHGSGIFTQHVRLQFKSGFGKSKNPLYLVGRLQFGVKLTEDLLQFFTDYICQNIQTTSERREEHFNLT